MIDIDKSTAKKNIEEIVSKVVTEKSNYVFINNRFITQEVMVYDKYRIMTFFLRIKQHDAKLKSYFYKKCRFVGTSNLFYELIISRIKMEEYKIENFESIEYLSDKNKLFFEDDSGKHYYKISDTNIYGFSQADQIERLKKFVTKINRCK